MRRRYRVRVGVLGAATIADGVDFTLDLGLLIEPPVATGSITHPVQGRTEIRPFRVLAQFPESLIEDMTTNQRWTAIGRLIDVGYQDADDDPVEDPWTTYGTGRISRMGEPDGRGRVELEVSDESWRARRSNVFAPDPSDLAATQNTTQLWPSGPKRAWRGHPAAHKATGTRVATAGNLYRIRMVAGGGGKQFGRDVTDKLHRWVRGDANDEVVVGGAATSGNFGRLRLNYGGTDYEVVSFGAQSTSQEITPDLLGRELARASSAFREVIVHAWVYSLTLPPSSGDAYLHAPSAPPSKDLPLHVGLDWDGHRWGVAGGFGWMHLADMTRRYFDVAGVAYAEDALNASEADLSIPALAFPVREDPEDEWAWFEDEVWGPNSHIVLRDRGGLLRLVDLRLPQDVDPDELVVLDAGNINAFSWTLNGREVVTSVTYHYLATTVPLTPEDAESAALDGYVYEEVPGDPKTADAQALTASGRRNVDYRMFGVLEPDASINRRISVSFSGRGGIFQHIAPIQARDVLDIYQDGAWRMSGEVDGRADVSEGQVCILNMASIKAANPDTQSRTGFRLVRILSLTTHPAHYDADVIDLGPRLVPLATPQVSLSQNLARHVVVTLSGTPAGAEATVEVAYTGTPDAPTSWVERRGQLGDGQHVFRDPPSTGYAHARVKARAPGRIRSPWVSPFPIQLLAAPRITGLQVAVSDTGEPTVFGTPNAATAGVRLRYVIHEAGDTPVFPEAS